MLYSNSSKNTDIEKDEKNMDKKEFLRLYNICMTETGDMKPCGRENCKKLLRFLNDPKYGNVDTGVLERTVVYELYKAIKSE